MGVVVAPVFPANSIRPDIGDDLVEIAANLAEIGADHVYGESLHPRGENIVLIEKALDEKVPMTNGFDLYAGRLFRQELRRAGLNGVWWPERRRQLCLAGKRNA